MSSKVANRTDLMLKQDLRNTEIYFKKVLPNRIGYALTRAKRLYAAKDRAKAQVTLPDYVVRCLAADAGMQTRLDETLKEYPKSSEYVVETDFKSFCAYRTINSRYS